MCLCVRVTAQCLCFASSVWMPPAFSPLTGCLRRRECPSATSASSAPPSSTRSMAERASCMFAPQNTSTEVGAYRWKESTHSLIKIILVGPVRQQPAVAMIRRLCRNTQFVHVSPVRSVNSSRKRGSRRTHETRDMKKAKSDASLSSHHLQPQEHFYGSFVF